MEGGNARDAQGDGTATALGASRTRAAGPAANRPALMPPSAGLLATHSGARPERPARHLARRKPRRSSSRIVQPASSPVGRGAIDLG